MYNRKYIKGLNELVTAQNTKLEAISKYISEAVKLSKSEEALMDNLVKKCQQKTQISDQTVIPIFSLISELESALATDSILVRIHKENGMEQKISAIQGFLDISRRYLILGFEKRACFAYLRAHALYSRICSNN